MTNARWYPGIQGTVGLGKKSCYDITEMVVSYSSAWCLLTDKTVTASERVLKWDWFPLCKATDNNCQNRYMVSLRAPLWFCDVSRSPSQFLHQLLDGARYQLSKWPLEWRRVELTVFACLVSGCKAGCRYCFSGWLADMGVGILVWRPCHQHSHGNRSCSQPCRHQDQQIHQTAGTLMSHTSSLPLDHGKIVVPSGRFPSCRSRPTDSLSPAGIWALFMAHQMMTLRRLPTALFRQVRTASTSFPHYYYYYYYY